MKGFVEFDETFMGAGNPLEGSRIPGFGAGNRTPETSRVHKRRAPSPRQNTPTPKGLARSAVAVVRDNPRKFEVRVKGTRALVGLIQKYFDKGVQSYLYHIPGQEPVKGFKTQGAAVRELLEAS